MITTLTNLTMNQAIELIKGTKNTIYRTEWLELLGKDVDPALVSVGEFEGGEIRFVANDEHYSPTVEDITANDWCILTEVEAEERFYGDNDFFDETIEEMAGLLLELQEAQVTLPRFMFFQQLADLFRDYFGEKAMENFIKTGEFAHDEECECGACFESAMIEMVEEMKCEADQCKIEQKLEETREAIIDVLSRMMK